MNLELLRVYALSFFGTRYFFGGDDPVGGFDCSGFVSELLRAAGVVPYNFRTNAQGIYAALKATAPSCEPQLGAIAFYGRTPGEIIHIAFCLDGYSMVEAGGGRADTVTDAKAITDNAFVRIRPTRFRKDFLFCVMPKYPAK